MATALAAIAAAAGQVGQIANGLKQMYQWLDGARSVAIVVENFTDQPLTRVLDQHESGGWKVTPRAEIKPGEALIFGSQDKGFMTGTIGWIRWRIGDPGPVPPKVGQQFFYMRWANPFIGANAAESRCWKIRQLAGPFFQLIEISDKYYSVATAGSGEVDAEMRFELRPRP
jgi:hypothetical protein